MSDSNDAMPDAIAPSKPGLGCAGAGASGPTVRETSRSFFSCATSAVRWRSLSRVAITLSSERAISAWLAGDGAGAASAADAPDASDAGATVALLIRLCNAGMTGVLLAAVPAACAPRGSDAMQTRSAIPIAAGHALMTARSHALIEALIEPLRAA